MVDNVPGISRRRARAGNGADPVKFDDWDENAKATAADRSTMSDALPTGRPPRSSFRPAGGYSTMSDALPVPRPAQGTAVGSPLPDSIGDAPGTTRGRPARRAARKAMQRDTGPSADDLNARVLQQLAMDRADQQPPAGLSPVKAVTRQFRDTEPGSGGMKAGGPVRKFAGGGGISRGDGKAQRGKTKGRHC